jgi:CRP/FNR family transcriptional regulator, nitrogen oxide reductase regulator
MKTESGSRRATATCDIAARVNELAPGFLEGFTPGDLAAILGEATPQRFRARSVIAREGHRADKVFLMLDGLARTFTTTPKGEKIILLWIPAGDLAGGRAFLSKPMDYLLNTETVTDSLALVWPRSAILPLAKRYPRLLENALLIASDYLAAYRDIHVAASHDSASQRVAQVLNKLAKGMGQRGFDGTILNVSNEELANEANVTIFTISRLLSKWQREGLLLKSRERIVVRSPEELIRSVS